MILKNKGFQLVLAAALGVIILQIPRPEGTRFRVNGDLDRKVVQEVSAHFDEIAELKTSAEHYLLEAKAPGTSEGTARFLEERAADAGVAGLDIEYVDGLSPKALRFLALLAVLIFLFIFEPIPLEITAILIGVSLALAGILDVKDAWAPYMHPVVVFIMCCLILAISLEKAGLTRRFGNFVARKAGTSVVRFTFILATGLGMASTVMHDAAACAFGHLDK